jgi:hypothetical protein
MFSSISYAILSLLLLVAMNSDCYSVGKTCFETCGHGCELALGIFQLGEFVDVSKPDQIYTEWPIGYAVSAYISFLLTSGTSALPLLIVQLVMLFMMGVIAANITERILPKWGILAFLLVVFNPSALGLAITLKTDLVFAFALSWALLFLINYLESWDWKWVAWSGVFLGLATHVRPTPQFLILLLPIICFLLAAVSQNTKSRFKHLIHGLVATAIAVAIVMPWFIFMHLQNETGRLYSSKEELSIVTSHVNVLNAGRDGLSIKDHRVEDWSLAPEEIVRRGIADWDELSEREMQQEKVKYAYGLLKSFDLRTYVVTGAVSVAGFFFSGGEGYLMTALNIADAEDGLDKDETQRVFILKIVTRGFTIITRILGLVGLWWLFANKHYAYLTLIVGSIAYFVAVHGFIGWSRFRIGVEIPLLVLATFGANQLFALLRAKGRRHQI